MSKEPPKKARKKRRPNTPNERLPWEGLDDLEPGYYGEAGREFPDRDTGDDDTPPTALDLEWLALRAQGAAEDDEEPPDEAKAVPRKKRKPRSRKQVPRPDPPPTASPLPRRRNRF